MTEDAQPVPKPASHTSTFDKTSLIFYFCSGLALGLLIFRFVFMPLGWRTGLSRFLEIAPPVLIFSSWQISRRQKIRKWSFKAFTLLSAIGLITGLIITWLIVPNPAHATLTHKSFPGFSLDLPTGSVLSENQDYANGKLELKDVGGARLALNISWEPGAELDDETTEVLVQTLAAAIEGKLTHSSEYWPGPNGAKIPSFAFSTPQGPAYASLLLCGGRRISIISLGQTEAETLQKRILLTAVCQPDKQLESTLNAVPWEFKSPAWKKLEGSPPGQVQLSDGISVLLIRRLAGLEGDKAHFKKAMTALFQNQAIQLEFGEWTGDYLNLRGSVEGNATVGWTRRFKCGDAAVFILGLSPEEKSSEQLIKLVERNGHCIKAS